MFGFYVIGPIVGALLAAAYTAIVLNPREKIEQRPIDTLSNVPAA